MRKHPIFTAPIPAAAFFAMLTARDAQAQSGIDYEKPNLSIPIPNVQFSNATVGADGRTVTIPFLANYITGIYTYAIGIATAVAAVMAIVGGFQYLTAGGDAGRVKAGRTRIMDAIAGVVLVLTAYALLNTISPMLVEQQGLEIGLIKNVAAYQMDSQLFTTQDDTAKDTGSPVTGSHQPSFPNCPISLSTASDGKAINTARVKEFQEKIGPYITASDAQGKILQAADAAAACGVNMGSCGQSVGTIKAIAGVSAPDCTGTTVRFSCWGSQTNQVPAPLIASFSSVLCKKGQGSGCVTSDAKVATKHVLDKIKEAQVPGWPDTWANGLKPGDTVIIYNGNPTGTHSVIFTGWSTDNKSMQVVHGSAGRVVKAGSICVKSTCAVQTPIIRIFRSQ